jgi:tetratricopeptide (TPR) repeat protein
VLTGCGSGSRRTHALALLAAWLLLTGAVPAADAPPQPELARFEPGVRTVLEEGLERFEAAVRDPDAVARGQAWGRLGMLYQAHHLQDLAETCYLEATALDPDAFRWRYLLGFVYQERGDFEAAEGAYTEALGLDPQAVNARLRRARVRAEQGRSDAAAEDFRQVLEEDPDQAAAHAGLGRLALGERRYQAARDHLERALALDPRADQLHYPLAIALRGLGDVADARAQMAQQGETEVAVPDPLLAEMSALTRSAQIYLEAGYAAARAGRDREAVAQFRQAVAFNPDDLAAQLGLGQGLVLIGDYPGAEAAFDRAVELAPEDAVARYRRGSLYAQTGRDELAVEDLAQALAADGDNVQAGFRLADALMRLGRYDEAAQTYGAVVPPPEAAALIGYRHGLAELAAGRCAAAARLFDEALASRPDSGELIQAVARTDASCDGVEPARRARALELAGQLFAARRDAAHATTLAMALAATGDFDRAVDLQEQLLASARASGEPARIDWHEQLLVRYRGGRAADRAWPAGDAVFRPSVDGAGPDRAGSR